MTRAPASMDIGTDLPLFELSAPGRRQAPAALGALPRRSTAALVALAWLPLALLALLAGSAWNVDYRASMLKDAAMHARFLLALPLLLAVPAICHPVVSRVVRHFVHAGLVRDAAATRFAREIEGTLERRDSVLARWIVVALVAAIAVASALATRSGLPGSWRAGSWGGLSPAGWWVLLVSNPIYHFVMLSFLHRLGLWWRFMWKIARLDLRLHPAHGDGAGGLAFLSTTLGPFSVAAFALSASIAGGIANFVMWSGASVVAHKGEILLFVVLIVAAFVGPMLFFAAPLAKAKRNARLEQGVLAGRQLHEFHRRWLAPGAPADADDPLTAPDFSAIADYGTLVANAQKMRALPFELREALPLVLGAVAPFLGVAAMEVPLKDLLTRLLQMLT